MTVIFAVLGQELLAAEQSVIATDGNGWQLHNLGPSLAQGTSSPAQGPRFARLPPPPAQGPVCYWPQMEASKCRRLPEPRLATALTQQTLGLLAESKTLNSGVPKALRLSAQSRSIQYISQWPAFTGSASVDTAQNRPRQCCSTRDLRGSHHHAQRKHMEAPCAAKTTMGPCCPRHGLRREDSCGSCGPCVLICKDQRIHSNCCKHLEATCTLGPSTNMTFSGLGSRVGRDVDAGLKVSSTLALVLFTCNRRWRYSPVCFGRAARSVCASEVPTRRPGPEEHTQLH